MPGEVLLPLSLKGGMGLMEVLETGYRFDHANRLQGRISKDIVVDSLRKSRSN